ncbi:hypothetical protein KSZ_18760 [Dictyobacter formicarum]|uniref:Uncharacterized protein n=1 Tax=Dictyobacter formicarum TaxID=2778368 RepID=A0ABQ3VCJ5_9CHLR|nr:hypothetical protein KSZ_18760 [Dictyobacter formicarum]
MDYWSIRSYAAFTFYCDREKQKSRGNKDVILALSPPFHSLENGFSAYQKNTLATEIASILPAFCVVFGDGDRTLWLTRLGARCGKRARSEKFFST